MFDFIVGKIDYVHHEYIVVEANGIGYQIYCPDSFAYEHEKGIVKVYTYHYVREDASYLYGFPSRREKMLFAKLLNVSGIGPKGGLAIMATGEPDRIITAIEQEDETFLTKFPGVGKKTARQMILDLKGKLDELIVHNLGATAASENETLATDAVREAIEALKALGYADNEIKKVIPQLEKDELTTDALVKKALQLLIHH